MTVDRRERVREDRTGPVVRRERVVRDANAEQRLVVNRIAYFIWFVFDVLIALIVLRIFLRLLAANPTNGFASFIYNITDIFVHPFAGLFPSPAPGNGGVFELSSLAAIVVYALLAWIIVRLVRLLFTPASVRKVQTYEVKRD